MRPAASAFTVAGAPPDIGVTIGAASDAARIRAVADIWSAAGTAMTTGTICTVTVTIPTEEDLVNIRVRLDELLPTKTAARSLPQAINRLETGDADQLILTTRNAPRAVLITIERYEQLLAGCRGDEPLVA